MLYSHRFFADLMERQYEYTTHTAETDANQQNTNENRHIIHDHFLHETLQTIPIENSLGAVHLYPPTPP